MHKGSRGASNGGWTVFTMNGWMHVAGLRGVLSGLAIVLSACGGGGDSTEPTEDNTRNLSKVSGDAQTAAAGTVTANALAVRVTNSEGIGVQGIQVTFAVASGGGSITGMSVTTDANGNASSGAWTLGQTAGANSATASIAGPPVKTVSFTATGVAGPAASLVKTAGDNQNAKKGSAVTVRPAVRVADQYGNIITGANVTFSADAGNGTIDGAAQTTGINGIATVGGWTLGKTGVNTLRASVNGATFDGNPTSFTATGDEILLIPSQDTTLNGVVNITRLIIPDGRIVTAGSSLTIVADSTVQVDGTLRGPCLSISLKGAQVVNVTGTIDNTCTQQNDNAPSLLIDAEGGYNLIGATIRSDGDIIITNDSTLTDADFPGVPAGDAPQRAVRGNVSAARVASDETAGDVGHGFCVFGSTFSRRQAGSESARNGTSGITGTSGSGGRRKSISCRGDLSFTGSVDIETQHGGDGGNGTHQSTNGAVATAGAGGDGGLIKLRASGNIIFSGSNRFDAGNGGNGGNATATGLAAGGSVAASAEARGGAGGKPGLVSMAAGGEIRFLAPTIILLGNAGNGGNATAVGANGAPAGGSSAQVGGAAVAVAGHGANGPSQTVLGSIVNPGNANIQGGEGGEGGDADATAGNGGAGSMVNPNGANAGSITSRGGNGGSATFTNLSGALVANGGLGGSARFAGGVGGFGVNRCSAPDGFGTGGNGGNGGRGEGGLGTGGAGKTPGLDGSVTVVGAGQAGTGGMGLPVGTTGTTQDAITQPAGHPRRTNSGAWFTQLVPFPCMVVQPPSIVKSIVPMTNCSSGFIDNLVIRNFGPEVVGVTSLVSYVEAPAGDVIVNLIAPVGGMVGVFGDVPANGGQLLFGGSLPPVVRLDCIHAAPLLACVRVTATLSGTTRTLSFPYRVRMTTGPAFNEAADRAACQM